MAQVTQARPDSTSLDHPSLPAHDLRFLDDLLRGRRPPSWRRRTGWWWSLLWPTGLYLLLLGCLRSFFIGNWLYMDYVVPTVVGASTISSIMVPLLLAASVRAPRLIDLYWNELFLAGHPGRPVFRRMTAPNRAGVALLAFVLTVTCFGAAGDLYHRLSSLSPVLHSFIKPLEHVQAILSGLLLALVHLLLGSYYAMSSWIGRHGSLARTALTALMLITSPIPIIFTSLIISAVLGVRGDKGLALIVGCVLGMASFYGHMMVIRLQRERTWLRLSHSREYLEEEQWTEVLDMMIPKHAPWLDPLYQKLKQLGQPPEPPFAQEDDEY